MPYMPMAAAYTVTFELYTSDLLANTNCHLSYDLVQKAYTSA